VIARQKSDQSKLLYAPISPMEKSGHE